MKISSASKKVLASALSAAMVVAFAPTAAFGLQTEQKITLGYDLNGGVDTATGQDVLNTSAKEVMAESVTVGSKYVEPATQPTSANFSEGTYYVQDEEGDYVLAKSYTAAADAKTAHEVATAEAGNEELTYKWDSEGKKYTRYIANNASAEKDSYIYYADAAGDMVKAEAVAEVETPTYYVKENVTAAGTTLSSNGKLQLKSGSSSYAFAGWEIGYDANGDGDFDDAADGDINVNDINNVYLYGQGEAVDLSSNKIVAGAALTAKAVYATPVINDEQLVANNINTDKGYATLSINVKNNVIGTPINGGKVVVTSPSGSATELSLSDAAKASSDGKITVAAEAGTWTVALVDGNGVTVDSYKETVSAVKLTGGIFKDQFYSGDRKATSAIAYYVKGDKDHDTYSEVLKAISTAAGLSAVTADGKAVSKTNPAASFYTSRGTVATSDTESENLPQKGEVTEIAASYGAAVSNFAVTDDDKYAASLTVSGLTYASLVDPAGDKDGYYIAVTDASGNIVRESFDTDKAKPANEISFTNGQGSVSATLSNLASGTYTATLYKVTGATKSGVSDGSAAVKTAVSSKTVTIDGVAAPTWSYASDADAAKGGTLTLANAAGTGYKVQYKVGSGAYKDYDETKPGITVSAADIKSGITVKAVATTTNKKDKTYDTYSNEVVLWGYNADNSGVNVLKGFVAAGATQTVNEQATVYYQANADVKAAIAAAEKTFSDAGFVAVTDGTADTEWNAAIISAEKSVLSAVAAVAKGEVAKYYAGITNADGTLTKVSDDNNAKAVAAIDAVLAAFDANHDSDKTNNVLNGKVAYTDADYYANIDAALVAAKKAAVTYSKADADVAKAVVAAGQSLVKPTDVTAANAKESKAAAEAVVKAYEGLTATQKQIVDAAVYENAKAVVTAADEAIAGADAAAVAKVKNKTLKTTTKKSKSVTFKTKSSEAGTTVTYKKANTAGKSKVTVSKSGKVTAKKGLKKGTYKVKVKATAGAATKTVTVTVKVAK